MSVETIPKGNELHPELVAFYKSIKKIWDDLYAKHDELGWFLQHECPDLEDKVNAAYVLRQTIQLLEDLRKNCNRAYHLSEVQVGVAQMQAYVNEPEEEMERIVTPHCSASSKVTLCPKIPHKYRESEQYELFMKGLEVPEHLYKGESELIKINYNRLMTAYTQAMEHGKQLVPGFTPSDEYTAFTLRIIRKKEIE